MLKAVEKTGVRANAFVAIEQFFPKGQRIIEDYLAYRMLPLGLMVLVSIMKQKAMRGEEHFSNGAITKRIDNGVLVAVLKITSKAVQRMWQGG